jgi:hypothetical protein
VHVTLELPDGGARKAVTVWHNTFGSDIKRENPGVAPARLRLTLVKGKGTAGEVALPIFDFTNLMSDLKVAEGDTIVARVLALPLVVEKLGSRVAVVYADPADTLDAIRTAVKEWPVTDDYYAGKRGGGGERLVFFASKKDGTGQAKLLSEEQTLASLGVEPWDVLLAASSKEVKKGDRVAASSSSSSSSSSAGGGGSSSSSSSSW